MEAAAAGGATAAAVMTAVGQFLPMIPGYVGNLAVGTFGAAVGWYAWFQKRRENG
jgi:hypothetical protein